MNDQPSFAISVRLEHRSESRSAGQRRHDLREGPLPRYVDRAKIDHNTVIVEPMRPAALRQLCEQRRSTRADVQRAMKADAAVSTHVIITFGRAAQLLFEALPVEVQDQAYRAVVDLIAAELGVHVTGLVAHRDETAPHAHGQFPAYRPDGQPLSKILRPAMASRLQDLAAEAIAEFAPGIIRGKRKADRISDGEDLSRIVHRSVRRLHHDLPREIAEAEGWRDQVQAAAASEEEYRDELGEEVADLEARLEMLRAEVVAKAKERDEREAEARKLAERVADLEAKVERSAAEEKRLAVYRRRQEVKAEEAMRLAAEATAAAQREVEAANTITAALAERVGRVEAREQAVEAKEEAIVLVVAMAADGRLRATETGITVPDEHMDALRLLPRPVRLALREIISLRDRWTRGIARLRNLLARNEVAAELHEEARHTLEDAPAP